MRDKKDDTTNFVIGVGAFDTVDRFGSASAEFLKGLRGFDRETGESFNLGLREIAGWRVNPNPDYAQQNIDQQAGYAAEVHKVSRDNAEHIIARSSTRVRRSEDVPGYGPNHTRVDHVETAGGTVVPGTESQMKFVVGPATLLDKIARGSGGGKDDLSRYLGVDHLDLPTEQIEAAKAHCRAQAASLLEQAQRVERDGKPELAARFREQAANYRQLENKIRDSGITRDEARAHRLDPEWETAKDIGRIAHRAGLEGAKLGAGIGGTIAVVTNAIAVHSGDKTLKEAALDTATGILRSAGVGYVTAASGSAIKGCMQQSASAYTRSLARTSFPALVVSVSIATGKSVHRYVRGDIDEAGLLEEVGGTATGMLSASMFSVVGQIAIPIPVVGAMVGSMVGYTISNHFYAAYMDAAAACREAEAQYALTRQGCEAARVAAIAYRLELERIITAQLQIAAKQATCLAGLLRDTHAVSADEFAARVNRFAHELGRSLRFETQAEFDAFMASDEPFAL